MEYIWKVYKLTSPCGRSYIGITRNTVLWRWKAHVNQAKRSDASPLYLAIREFGRDSFKIESLAECFSELEAQKCERAMIALHDTFHKGGHGFNLSIGGNGNTGGCSDKTKEKLRAAMAERSEENRAHLLIQVRRYNEMGRPISERGRAAKRRGLEIGWTKRHSPESNAKRSVTCTGKKQSPTHHAKSIEACRAARAAKTPDSFKKQAETRKKMWADPEYAELSRHRFWALCQYEKTLAAKVGRDRPYSFRGRSGEM